MSPDWQSICHLLLCWLDETADVQVLVQLLHQLDQALPHIKITVLMSSSNIQLSNIQLNNIQLNNIQTIINPQWNNYSQLVETLSSHTFDAAVLLTAPGQSPFSIGYLCYLAAIPIRIGQSQEFGGGVLSHCITPLVELIEPIDYHLHLLRSSGLLPSLSLSPQFTQPLESQNSYAVTNPYLAHSR